jgi:hypothetical protein
VIAISSLFYLLGKLIYDNDEVIAQFEPLEGMIALKKKEKKKGEENIDYDNFEKKYKVKVRELKGILSGF